MKMFVVTAVAVAATALSAHAGEKLQMPPEVTPVIRAACESDVRRLCIGANPTIEGVKTCVAQKFRQLGRPCQVQLTMAGLAP